MVPLAGHRAERDADMTTWTSGYVADVPYTHGVYRELAPSFLRYAGLLAGIEAPDPGRRLTYLDLGCGQGFSANLIAAANPGIDVHGVDFNPTHILGARTLAGEAGLSNATFHKDSFEDFLHNPDAPQFDIIVLHGILSWVAAERRAEIVELVRRKLITGGLVYASYNALPGWAAAMPLRRLLYDHAAQSRGPMLDRIAQALAFADALRDAGGGLFASNPLMGHMLDHVKTHDLAYVAHEFFNRDWIPLYHGDVVDELGEAKVSYVGSAGLLEQIDSLNLTSAQAGLLSSIPDPSLRETARDALLGTQFRKDLFLRGVLPLASPQVDELWLDSRVALTSSRAEFTLQIKAPIGEVTLHPDIYEPLCAVLAEGPVTNRQLLGHEKMAGRTFQELREAINVLIAVGFVQPCLGVEGEAERAVSTAAFNAAIVKRAELSTDLGYVASPVTGCGIALDRMSQLFLGGWRRKAPDIPAYVWGILSAQNQRLTKDGRIIESEEGNLLELAQMFAHFLDKRIPMLQRLGIG